MFLQECKKQLHASYICLVLLNAQTTINLFFYYSFFFFVTSLLLLSAVVVQLPFLVFLFICPYCFSLHSLQHAN